MVTRDQYGKFISREAMLGAWLPRFLNWSFYDPLVAMLECACKWCVIKSSEELKLNAEYLRKNSSERHMWLGPVDRVKQWKQRREILFEAIEKLKVVK
jgi:hypothetical protein